ncbi:MAG TPA: ribosome maturation factor [Flavisolibacter sp.]|jgi:ribosome maturation factor RimP|nr:ribosome maturation factor [Flavisolibacter sp.]
MKKGTTGVPFLFYYMQTETLHEALERHINTLLEDNSAHFLVEVRIKPTNNIKIFIDSDEGIILSTLIQYNRKLYKIVEESGLVPPDNFSLEVSSPGLDEPLKKHRQYKKNVGRDVHITKNDTLVLEGKLIGVNDEGVTVEIETGKGKKKEIKQETVLFTDIKTTKIQIKF